VNENWKKAEYRQVAVVFGCIAVILALLTAEVIFEPGWTLYAIIALIVFIIVYAIASSIKSYFKQK